MGVRATSRSFIEPSVLVIRALTWILLERIGIIFRFYAAVTQLQIGPGHGELVFVRLIVTLCLYVDGKVAGKVHAVQRVYFFDVG